MGEYSSKVKEPAIVKVIHYVTLIGIILLIIPAGLNPMYFNIGFVLFGINLAVRSTVLLKSNKKGEFTFTLIACLFLIGFGLFRLFLA
ncbi:hypothetical protein P4U97_17715 [Bacillus swezeyi]|uniref:hypothetical protein n=1 Tax=Bacillus swezeyi TaxID=1925020 RepID=UPI0027DBBB03|nr:hypothetical protein [Bacillus swezeyi]MED1741320.1 hypothetical protein [Bacillus swezeyi]